MTRSDKYQCWQGGREQGAGPNWGSSDLDRPKSPWTYAPRKRAKLVCVTSQAWNNSPSSCSRSYLQSKPLLQKRRAYKDTSFCSNIFLPCRQTHLILHTSQTQLPDKPTTCLTCHSSAGPLTRYKSWALRTVQQGLNSWSDLCQLLQACLKTKRAFQFSSVGLAKPQHSQLSPAGFDSALLSLST